MNLRSRLFATAALSALALTGCSSGTTSVGTASSLRTAAVALPAGAYRTPKDSLGGVPLYLFDAPPSFDGMVATAITLPIVRVDAIGNGTPVPMVSFSTPVLVNILQYQQTPLLLGKAQLPAGNYTGLHLVLSRDGATISFGSTTYSLALPTATAPTQSDVAAGDENHSDDDNGSTSNAGITFNVPFTSTSGGVTMDFNALESIARVVGGFAVRPVVFAGTNENNGTITGSVLNASGGPVSNATVIARGPDSKVRNTTTTAADGSYTLHNVAAGTQYLTAYNQYKAGAGQTIYSSGASNNYRAVTGPAVNVPAGGTVTAPAISD